MQDDTQSSAGPAPTHLPVPTLSLVLPHRDDRKVAVGALALQEAGVDPSEWGCCFASSKHCGGRLHGQAMK